MEKKKMKLWKKILIGVLVLASIFLILIARKFIIITRLVNVSKQYANKTNYSVISSSIQRDMGYLQKSYNKDGNFLTQMKIYSKKSDNVVTVTSYKNGNDKIYIIENGEERKISRDSQVDSKGVINSIYSFYGDHTMDNLKNAITSRITIDDYNGKECYLIQMDNNLMLWVDKTTGLVYRQISGGFGVTEFIYEFDIVNDNDIKKPDIF